MDEPPYAAIKDIELSDKSKIETLLNLDMLDLIDKT